MSLSDLILQCFTVNLKLSMAAGFKTLMVRDTSGTYSTPFAPLTHLSETNTSSSQETVKRLVLINLDKQNLELSKNSEFNHLTAIF